ncbi:unnamed protein product [Nesidiocoris tenuis]|uniref:Uncharacterized protein n=1 Tax=Nesidiocoris tenuis TaxID=355587 RepID=A0A6H5H2G0_9HEMI|nr:unnamed protein product [Nesidiocoris tenuis]
MSPSQSSLCIDLLLRLSQRFEFVRSRDKRLYAFMHGNISLLLLGTLISQGSRGSLIKFRGRILAGRVWCNHGLGELFGGLKKRLNYYRRRSGEISYLHFVKTATIPMVPYVTTLNFHDVSNVHVQVRNWRYEISPLRHRYLPSTKTINVLLEYHVKQNLLIMKSLFDLAKYVDIFHIPIRSNSARRNSEIPRVNQSFLGLLTRPHVYQIRQLLNFPFNFRIPAGKADCLSFHLDNARNRARPNLLPGSFTRELPKKDPLIHTEKDRYDVGDTLRANCSSAPSKPAASLSFFLNENPFYIIRIAYVSRLNFGKSFMPSPQTAMSPTTMSKLHIHRDRELVSKKKVTKDYEGAKEESSYLGVYGVTIGNYLHLGVDSMIMMGSLFRH